MEVRCPGCERPLPIPDELCASSDSDDAHTITSVDCPNCGSVSLGPGYHRTIAYQAPTEPLEVQQVAHFALLRQLGRGGFGAVWLARDLTLEREVALKLPVTKGGEAASLLHEAQTAASLRHPNIVSIYEVGVHEGRAYIASEYIDGLTLRDFLSAGRPPVRRTVELLISVAQALHHAHEHGVVHRDVKPANILLSKQGQPFVADFGIAKRISAESTITSEGRVVGTARYMSPEQASGKTRETDRRSDIYAFGVILFEMLTGDTPFRGNVRALLHQKTFEEAPSPRRLDPAVPRDLETICLKCLEREPPKRYSTAHEVADELTRFLNSEPIQARPITSLERVWRRCRRRPVVAGLVAALFLSLSLGLAGVSYFWLRASANAAAARQSLYRAQMFVAATYLDSGDIAGVRQALNRFRPGTPQARLRGFEWHYFDQATDAIKDVANQGNVVFDVAITRDGDLCAACSDDRNIRVWDARTGELVRTLSPDAGKVKSIAFSPTTGHLAAGSTDGRYWIWNPLKEGRPLQRQKHGKAVSLVHYSPNGKLLLTASDTGAVRIWDIDKESLVVEIPTGGGGMKDACFTPNGERVVVASSDGLIRVWEIATRQIVHKLSPNPSLQTIAISDDGRTIAAAGSTGHLRIWLVEDETLERELEMKWPVGSLKFTKNSRVLAVATLLGNLHFFDLDHGRELAKLKTHNLTAGKLARSANGKWLAVGSGDGSVKVVRIDPSPRPNVYWHDMPVRAVAFLASGEQIVAGDVGGQVRRWNIETAASLDFERIAAGAITTIAVQEAGQLVAAGGGGPEVGLWDASTGKVVERIDVGENGAMALAFNRAGQTLAVAVRAGPVLIYEAANWKQPRLKIEQPEFAATALAFKDDRALLAGYADGDVREIDTSTGQSESLLKLSAAANSLALCEQGRLLALGTDAGEIYLWDLSARRLRQVVKGHSGRIASLASLSPEGRLVSASRDRDLKLWDLSSGEPITTLIGHDKQIFSVAVSPDGRTLASGGLLGDIRIWRGQTAE